MQVLFTIAVTVAPLVPHMTILRLTFCVVGSFLNQFMPHMVSFTPQSYIKAYLSCKKAWPSLKINHCDTGTVAPLVPHGDCCEAQLLHCWTGLEPVYAKSSKLYSFTPEVLDKHMHFRQNLHSTLLFPVLCALLSMFTLVTLECNLLPAQTLTLSSSPACGEFRNWLLVQHKVGPICTLNIYKCN